MMRILMSWVPLVVVVGVALAANHSMATPHRRPTLLDRRPRGYLRRGTAQATGRAHVLSETGELDGGDHRPILPHRENHRARAPILLLRRALNSTSSSTQLEGDPPA